MHSQSPKRAGWALAAAGALAATATALPLEPVRPCLAVLAGLAIVGGIALLLGGPRAALWVRSCVVFLLAAAVTALLATPLYQPLNLTITEIRLHPNDFAIAMAAVVPILGFMLWINRDLGRPQVLDAIATAHIRRWTMHMPAQAGSGVVILSELLLWLMLHGQSAELATSLAVRQLGPGYRYHLSWISNSGSGHGSSVTGVVVAWNRTEVKRVLLHWETP